MIWVRFRINGVSMMYFRKIKVQPLTLLWIVATYVASGVVMVMEPNLI
jgi:hypothetical protein